MKNVNRFTSFAGSALLLITLPFRATAKTIYVWNGSQLQPGPIQCPGQNDPKNMYSTIQAGVDAAAAGDTVFVCEGTYLEQVTINKALRLQGENLANTTIMPPATPKTAASLFSGKPVAYIVLVDRVKGNNPGGKKDDEGGDQGRKGEDNNDDTGNTTVNAGVVITDFTIDGESTESSSCGSNGFVGVYYRGSDGEVHSTHVTHICDTQNPSNQNSIGIFVQSGKGNQATVSIDSNSVDRYGKNGITGNEDGTRVTVLQNATTGRGHVADNAQNGIQIGFGAQGQVIGNVSSHHFFTGTPAANACGILFFDAKGGTKASGNFFVDNQQNVCATKDDPPSPTRM